MDSQTGDIVIEFSKCKIFSSCSASSEHPLWWIIGQPKGQLSDSLWGSTHSCIPLEMFFCSLKNTVFTRGTRAQRAKLWKEMTIVFPIHFFLEQKNLCTCCKCKTERCQKWNAIGISDKGETAVRDHFRERNTLLPVADGSFIVMAGGGWDPKKRDARPQKRLDTWLDCDTCPTGGRDFTHLAFGVSSCYQSCHVPPPCPPALYCSVLHVDKGIKENR